MSDSELVASIVAGDPEGLAAAYDKYASDLYGYCQSLLQEPNDAADAVQDTFVIAASKLGGLRDPERLRAWLFAVARNECLHRLKSRHAATSLQDAPEPPDDTADVGAEAERAEAVALIRAAVGGLNTGERDVINQLWHGLEVSEVAAVLGVSRNYAYTLFSRAREQLEASVAVLVVGRSGRRDCPALDTLLGDWDGRLTAPLRKRVGRHIDQCRVCSDRRRQELTPALLYGLTPAAVLAMSGLHHGGPLLAGHLAAARDVALHAAASGSQAGAAGGAAGGSTHAFGANGFPKPVHTGMAGLPRLPHLPLATVGGTAAAAAVAVVVTVVVPHLGSTPSLAVGPRVSVPAPGAVPSVMPDASGGASTAPGAIGGTASAGTHGSTGTATRSPAPPSGPADRTTAPSYSPTVAVTSSAPPWTPTDTASATSSGPDGPWGDGWLSVSPATVVLSRQSGGSLTLTANGGPVFWYISEPADLQGSLTVWPSSGILDAGQSTTVTLTVSGLDSLNCQLTVEPGDQQVTVVLDHQGSGSDGSGD